MKIFLSAALLAALTVSSVGCLSEAQSATNESGAKSAPIQRTQKSRAYLHSYNLPSHGVAIEGYCPVAYFAVNKPVKGKPEHASTYNGVTYHFVSADAKKAFDKNPEKYIPAYGGWCAFGMAVSDKFPIDPTNYLIVDGKLFLFLRNPGIDAREAWKKGNERELLKKATAHWKVVRG